MTIARQLKLDQKGWQTVAAALAVEAADLQAWAGARHVTPEGRFEYQARSAMLRTASQVAANAANNAGRQERAAKAAPA